MAWWNVQTRSRFVICTSWIEMCSIPKNCVTVGTPAMMNWQPSPKMMFRIQISRFQCQLPIPDVVIGMKCALCSRMNVLTSVQSALCFEMSPRDIVRMKLFRWPVPKWSHWTSCEVEQRVQTCIFSVPAFDDSIHPFYAQMLPSQAVRLIQDDPFAHRPNATWKVFAEARFVWARAPEVMVASLAEWECCWIGYRWIVSEIALKFEQSRIRYVL